MNASEGNCSNTPLAGGATFTGTLDLSDYPDVMISCKTDATGTLYVEFSTDSGANWDSSLTIALQSGVNEFHTLVKGPRACRVRLVNGDSAQTYLRLATYFGSFRQANSPLNANIQSDADAITARVIGEESFTAEGRYTGRSIVNKFGDNSDVDTGTTPEDIWGSGGTYTGFPTGAAETFQAFSSDASDTGVLSIIYLASATAADYSTASVTLQGTTPVSFGVSGIRMHSASYASGSSTGFNVGTITVRHATTTANVFCAIAPGRSQSNASAYTVPYGSTAYMRRFFCRVIGSTSGSVDGALWVRTSGGSPRLRRPFSATNTAPFEERPYGGISFSAGSDIVVRVSSASANNLDVIAGYDLVLVKS